MKKLLCLSLIVPIIATAQLSPEEEAEINSLKKVIEKAEHDTIVVKAWVAWDNMIYITDPDLDFELNKKIDSLCSFNLEKPLSQQEERFFLIAKGSALNNIGLIFQDKGDYTKAHDFFSRSLKIYEEIPDKQGIANSYTNIGCTYQELGDYTKAIDYQFQSLKISEEIKNKKAIATSFNNIANIYLDQGDYSKAIDYYSKSLKISEEIGDKEGMAVSLNNIGLIYDDQGDHTKAIDYFSRSLKMEEEIGNEQGIATSLNNIGNIYQKQGDDDKAIDYFTQSLKISEEIGDKAGIAFALSNLGNIYKDQADYTQAIDNYSQSLKIREEIGDKQGAAKSFNDLGLIYQEQRNYAKALDYSLRALSIAQEIGAAMETIDAAKSLWETNKALGRFKDALAMHELYITTKNDIESEENQKEIIRQEYKYEYEKQAATDSIKSLEEKKVKDAEIARQDAELTNKRYQQYALYGGLGLLIVFLGFVYNRFRVTNQQKKVIQEKKNEVESQKKVVEEAHELLEEKNKEILDSIRYAKRIQSAILPPQKLVKEFLPESFIFYKPKDIVAGDFYWMETIESENLVLFAAADCTGHGVPGAMVSVVCNNGLNRSVREHGLTEPGKILDKTREIVIAEFEKSEEEVKDGMDISLCALNTKTNKLLWSGANNPLWIIRNEEVLETNPDKQPIGKVDNPKPFTTNNIALEKGDIVYIFTDGFQDQFGGDKGKKFKPSNLKKLLQSIRAESMEKQREIIDGVFEEWRGSLEQVDDVCVIGVRI